MPRDTDQLLAIALSRTPAAPVLRRPTHREVIRAARLARGEAVEAVQELRRQRDRLGDTLVKTAACLQRVGGTC